MPPNDADNLADNDVRDILAYILKFNGFDAGSHPLPASAGEMNALTISK